MAVTKIWDVKNRLDHVINYVNNPEKTETTETDQTSDLDAVLAYAANPSKTEHTCYVTGLNCEPETAVEEMRATKQQYFKTDGIIAFHACQSFAPGEVTPETAHAMGVKLAEKLWGDRFEVIIATHLDRAHLHNHFVINSVSFKDGRRYYDNKATYRLMQETSDALCREFGLSVIEHPERGNSMHYSEWQAAKEGRPTWRSTILSDIDATIAVSVTLKQFLYYMRKKGYAFKPNAKYFTLKPPGKTRYVRIDRHYPDYSLAMIENRIRTQPKVKRYMPLESKQAKRIRLKGTFQKGAKFTGLRGLYMHYCYKLGIFPKKQQDTQEVMHFLYREELRHLDRINAETLFLCRNHIETDQDLQQAKSIRQEKYNRLIKARKQCANHMRYSKEPDERESMKEKKAALSQDINALRKEIAYCEGIEKRAKQIREKMARVCSETQKERRGEKNHEYRR